VPSLRSFFSLNLLANHFPALHGLRVLGVISVIQIHLTFELGLRGILHRKNLVYSLSQTVWYGMDLFFLLSGLLIGSILLRTSEGKGARGIANFYLRRSFRIIPLYYVVLTALALWFTPDARDKVNLLREYLYLTNYSDNHHVVMFWAWSLCVEEHFYLTIPFLMAFLRYIPGHRGRIVTLTLLWLSAPVVRGLILYWPTLLPASEMYQRLYLPTHTRYDTLIAGVLIAYLLHAFEEPLRRALARPLWRWSLVIGGFTGLFFMSFPPGSVPDLWWGLISMGTVSALALGALVIHLVAYDSWASRLLGTGIFVPLATLGYGAYLVHMPLVRGVGVPVYTALVKQHHMTPAQAYLIAVPTVYAAAVLVAYLLHLVIEKPALALRDRLTSRARSLAPAPPDAATPASAPPDPAPRQEAP
jgi:peptidoglycan/LPS O-acetylase OafA/YrhL